MTKIEDMSESERQAWITLIADGAVFIWFWNKMTVGLSPRPIHTNMDEFGSIVLGVVIFTVILHAIIATVFDLRKRKEKYQKDERDSLIEGNASKWGYTIMQWGVGIIIVTMFLHTLIGPDYTPPVPFQKPVEIIFALMVVSYIADLVKYGLMVKAYRG